MWCERISYRPKVGYRKRNEVKEQLYYNMGQAWSGPGVCRGLAGAVAEGIAVLGLELVARRVSGGSHTTCGSHRYQSLLCFSKQVLCGWVNLGILGRVVVHTDILKTKELRNFTVKKKISCSQKYLMMESMASQL